MRRCRSTGCVGTLDPVLCGGIGRTAAGTINRFNNQLINIGGTTTKGYDINLRYVLPETPAGPLRRCVAEHEARQLRGQAADRDRPRERDARRDGEG